MQDHRLYDLIVVGGGINGCGIARDAAGRGLDVLLCEKDDLASHTSGASTKLIHGGLRYLEYYKLGLVRKSLREREVLLRAAPHIIHPLRFVMPHDASQRPQWMIRAGLFLYDHLARRGQLPGCEHIRLHDHPTGAALKPEWASAFAYSDARVNDARLVVLNAMSAAEHGARILTRTRLVSASREADHWQVRLESSDGTQQIVHARVLVNAAGPWVASLLRDQLQTPSRHRIRLVKGSHIVVPRIFDHDNAYLFQNPDRRIIFAIPFEDAYTMIGTTDVDVPDEPDTARIDAGEEAYLCAMASRFFRQPVTPEQIVWRFSGIRALLDDKSGAASSVTRDYALELDANGPPLLSVFGGKLTTYRKLAEEVLEKLQPLLGNRTPSWTAEAHLPGGDLPGGDFSRFLTRQQRIRPWLPAGLVMRLASLYGSRIDALLGAAQDLTALGEEVLPGLYEAEIRYLLREEFARNAEDILWRRTRLGLHLGPHDLAALQAWLDRQHTA